MNKDRIMRLSGMAAVLLCLTVSCNSSMKGLEGMPTAHIALPALPEVKSSGLKLNLDSIPESADEDTRKDPDKFILVGMDGVEKEVYADVRVEWDSVGESNMTSLTLNNVEVIGRKTRNTAERNGMICIDFVLSVPRTLQHEKRMLSIYPVVIREGNKDSLQEVRFTGADFRKKQEKDYDEYNRFLDKIIPDTADFYTTYVNHRKFERYMRRANSRYDRLLEKCGRLDSMDAGETLLGRRFSMFNEIQARNAAIPLYQPEKKQYWKDKRLTLKQWVELKMEKMPHYRLVREETSLFEPIVADRMNSFTVISDKRGGKEPVRDTTPFILEEDVIDKRRTLFNEQQRFYAEKALNRPPRERVLVTEGNSFREWYDRNRRVMPHFWLQRDSLMAERMLADNRMETKRKLEESVVPDSAEAVKGFYNHKKIEKNNRLNEMRDEMFGRIVKHPYNGYARLDSVVHTPDSVFFFYRHSIKSDEASSRIYLTTEGKAVNYRNETYNLPPGDTLTFFVSSMTYFLVDRVRYVEKLVRRDMEVNFSAHLNFHVGKSDIEEDLDNNREELQKLMQTTYNILTDTLYEIDGIVQTAYSSPEGNKNANKMLADKRGNAVNAYLNNQLRIMGDTLLSAAEYVYDEATETVVKKETENPIEDLVAKTRIVSEGEDWNGLKELIENDETGNIKHKKQILKLFETVTDYDAREWKLAGAYPQDYKYIRQTFYEKLRRVDFRFLLRRKGMLEETVVTNEPDTVYANGLALLKKRDYEGALERLRKYEDENTAVAYMSLGYDKAAERVLAAIENPTEHVLYLQALVAARMGKEREAAKHLLDACEKLPRLRFRANLDPELSALIKKYNLFDDDF